MAVTSQEEYKKNLALMPEVKPIIRNYLYELTSDLAEGKNLNISDGKVQAMILKHVDKNIADWNNEVHIFARKEGQKGHIFKNAPELFEEFISSDASRDIRYIYVDSWKTEGNLGFYINSRALDVLSEKVGNTATLYGLYREFIKAKYPGEKIMRLDLTKVDDEFMMWVKEEKRVDLKNKVIPALRKGMKQKIDARIEYFLAELGLTPSDLGKVGLANVPETIVERDLPDAVDDYLDMVEEDGDATPQDWLADAVDNTYIDMRLNHFINHEKINQLHIEKILETYADNPLTSKLPRSKWEALLSQVSPDRIKACFMRNGRADSNRTEHLAFTLVPDLEDRSAYE